MSRRSAFLGAIAMAIFTGCAGPSASALPSAMVVATPSTVTSPAPSLSAAAVPTPIPSTTTAEPTGSLLFQRASDQEGGRGQTVWVVPAGHGDPALLGEALDASWAGDGATVHLVTQDADCVPSLTTMTPAGGDVVVVSYGLASLDYDFTWSPDGRQVTFIRFRDGPPPKMCGSQGGTYGSVVTDLWVMDADGTHARVLVADYLMNGLHSVVWSPDSMWVAYLGPTIVPSPDGAPISVVFIRVRDGRRTESGTSVVGSGGTGLAWSPDGTRLAFSFWADPTGAAIHIAVIGADEGSDSYVDITSGDIPDMRLGAPIWAPDNASIAVSRELISADGSTITGGGILLFDAARSGVVRDLGVVDADGPGTPTWSADGAWIAYASEVHDAAGTHPGPIVEAAVDGTARRDVSGTDTTDGSTWIEWTAWRPVAP